MIEDDQPNPDELLKAIQEVESKQSLGKLKIFFGMSAGVGKTYAMLEAAHRKSQEGVNIAIGTINTHGRKETEALLKGLIVIAEKWVKYKDTVFEEMDLEAILNQKPAIVLVDELAHTNVPGSRHPKRWQDVMELLDEGIDVYTTLNVQHVESRKDLVESFAKVQIRETVPDLILERAADIALVDISPSALLERLKEGKVYLGDQSKAAARHFFKEETLTALREIALRLTAEKVDHDLHSILSQGKKWKTHEKLMVGIDSNPSSLQLIRKTRRRAFELDAKWIAVYVDVGNPLSDEEESRLTSHLNLAAELGAEVITTADSDIASALLRLGKIQNITQLLIGRSDRKSKWNFFRKSLAERLLEDENRTIDLSILRQEDAPNAAGRFLPPLSFSGIMPEYAASIGAILAISAIGFVLTPLIGYKSVGFIFLLGILQLSFYLKAGPVLLAALLSTLAWDFFFIPPVFDFTPTHPEDVAFIFIYFSTAAIIGVVNSALRREDEAMKIRERNLQQLYELEREIAAASNKSDLRRRASSRLRSFFKGDFDILLKKQEDDELVFDSPLQLLNQEKEQAAALWVLRNGKIAGWSTSTLPSSKALYFPIKFTSAPSAVLAYIPRSNRLLTVGEINFLHTASQQISLALQRELKHEQKAQLSYTAQSEKLHLSLLHSVSEKLYGPLNQISDAAKEMQALKEAELFQAPLEQIVNAEIKLKLMIDHTLALSELESGFVKFEKTEQNVRGFAESCVKSIEPFIQRHAIRFFFPEQTLLADFDPRLMEEALNDLILRMALSLPPGEVIEIGGSKDEDKITFIVSCKSYAIESGILHHLLDAATLQSEGKPQDEVAGLAIAKIVMDIHQGKIEVRSSKKEGTVFSLTFPEKFI